MASPRPRTIQSPGIEITEIDKSQYSPPTTALPQNTAVFGFASMGPSLEPTVVTSLSQYELNFGTPKTEAERYLYYTVQNCFNEGAPSLVVTKLPYALSAEYHIENSYRAQGFKFNSSPVRIAKQALTSFTGTLTGNDGNTYPVSALTFTNGYLSDAANSDISLSGLTGTVTLAGSPVTMLNNSVVLTETNFDSAAIGSTLIATPTLTFTSRTLTGSLSALTGLTASISATVADTLYSGSSFLEPWNSAEITSIVADVLGGDTKVIMPDASMVTGTSLSATYVSKNDFDILQSQNKYNSSDVPDMSSACKALSGNDFTVVLQTNNTYGPYKKEGIFVVFTDVFDAIAAQRIVTQRDLPMTAIQNIMLPIPTNELLKQADSVRRLWDLQSGDSVSEDLMGAWPNIEFDYTTIIDPVTGAETVTAQKIKPEFCKMIGVHVCKASSSPEMAGKVLVQIIESFVGSLDKNFVSTSSKKNAYIRDIINSRSEYIQFFPNETNIETWLNSSSDGIPLYIGDYSGYDHYTTGSENANIATYPLLGYDTQSTSVKKLKAFNDTLADLLTGLQKISNPDEIKLNLIADAGLSNILNDIPKDANTANFASLEEYEVKYKDPITSFSTVQNWNRVCKELINFCQNTRKDCMAIIDAPRQLGLRGNIKRVRKTDPTSNFFNQISFQLKYISNLDSSYAAEYCTWVKMDDGFSGVSFWAPPSTKIASIYYYNDKVGNVWDAPAGVSRGGVRGISDITFNVSQKENDSVYPKGLNIIRSFPVDGFVVEGQRTTQIKPSALDRINVRRLMLYMEDYTKTKSNAFKYQNNTLQTRRNYVATLNPFFSDLKINGGLVDYLIVCDERNNTPDTIDNNELRVSIATIAPRAAEFILIDFVIGKTGANLQEIVGL